MQKKGKKYIFNFEIHTKNTKNGKKKAHLFGFFSLLYPLCIFLHFKPKNAYKKKQKCKKKLKFFFKFAKYIHTCMQKKQKIIFQKRQGVYTSKNVGQNVVLIESMSLKA